MTASGLPCKAQAAELGIRKGTISYHMERIAALTGARGIAGITRYAIASGLLRLKPHSGGQAYEPASHC